MVKRTMIRQRIAGMGLAAVLAAGTVTGAAPLTTLADEGGSEDTYVLMNIPYDEFYSTLGVKVDAVSSATQKAQNSGVAGAVYNGAGNIQSETDKSSIKTKGVQYAVKVDNPSVLSAENSKYKELTDESTYYVSYSGRGETTNKDLKGQEALIQADDYAYYKLAAAPGNYLELNAEGTLTAGNIKATAIDGTTSAASAIAYNGHWGTYIIDLSKLTSLGAEESTEKIAGVKVVTDKVTFGLQSTDHIWRNYEIAWKTTDEGLADTNGATLQSLTVYTDSNVYEITLNQKLKTLSTATISANIKGEVGSVSGLPSDIQNPKATISYTTGTGRNAKPANVITDATVAGGQFDVPDKTTFPTDQELKVTVSSDNYIDITGSVTRSTSTDTYVLMNIPYEDFEKLMDDGESAEIVDAVSSPTVKVRNSGVAGLTYSNTGNTTLENKNETDNDTAKGVQFPVKVSDTSVLNAEKYKKLTTADSYTVTYSGRGRTTTTTVAGKAALIAAGDYSYVVLADDPKVYLGLTDSGLGKGNVTEISVKDSSPKITYGGHHQTYEIALPIAKSGDGTAASGISGTVAAVKVTTDKLSFWLRPTDQIWRSQEIGWTPTGSLAVTNGATLQSYTVYTDEGVYNVSVNQTLKTLADGGITASASGSSAIRISGLPSDIKNPQITVKTGSGRSAKEFINDPVAVTNGRAGLPSGKTLTSGWEYTVTVTSDNYTDMTAAFTYTRRSSSGGSSSGSGTASGFTDVPSDAWYKNAVDWAVQHNVTSGKTTTIFAPKEECSRAEMVTFLYNLAGKPAVTGTSKFTDVKADTWYTNAVLWAEQNNVAAGKTDTIFAPDDTCTRAQAVTFIRNYAKDTSTDTTDKFTDVPADAWYAAPVAWAVKENVTAGMTPTTFVPGRTCTRAEMVTFIYNYAK